jgi:hypothetical protein
METKNTNDQRNFRGLSGFAVLVAVSLSVFLGPAGTAWAQPGVQLPTLFAGIQVNEPDHDRWAHALVDAGFDTVQVTLYARQQAWNGATLYWDREAPWVLSEIRAARRAGLRVILVMRVALEHGLTENRHLWHGMIWPRDDLVDDWFDAYGAFVLWGAQLAADESVDLFAVGNELSSMTSTTRVAVAPALYAYYSDPVRVQAVHARLVECADVVVRGDNGTDLQQLDGGTYPDLGAMLAAVAARNAEWAAIVAGSLDALNARRAHHEARWRRLVREVRNVYSGPLTYGANFDQFDQVGFWDVLDAVSVNAYFPLSRYGTDRETRRADMAARWEEIGAALSATADLPVVLLELGWTRRAGSTVRPYSYDRVEVLETAPDGALTCVHWASQPDDPYERVDALEALGIAVERGHLPRLRGFTLWKLTTNAAHRDIEPFAAVLGAADPVAGTLSAADRADAAYVAAAGRVAQAVRGRR